MVNCLKHCQGFQWDEGNATKNWEKHSVTQSECEQPFFNHPFIVAQDAGHSQAEERFFALGYTDAGRELFLVFTLRDEFIRVISTRDMNRKERKWYREQKEKTDSGL